MNAVLNFISNNYIWIVIFCLFLILTLIGYLADSKNREENAVKKEDKKEKVEEIKENITLEENMVSENKTEEPKTLDELIKQSNINAGNKLEENNEEMETTDENTSNIINEEWQPELKDENEGNISTEEGNEDSI